RGWCRRPDSNRDGAFAPTDFKSDASTVPPRRPAVVSNTAGQGDDSARSAFAGVTPSLVPELAGRIGNAAVLLEELVRHLEDAEQDAALRRPGRMPAVGLAPDELAFLRLDARGRAI